MFNFLPDLDLYYNKDLDVATALVDELVDAGCNAIKIAMCTENAVLPSSDFQDVWVSPKGLKRRQRLFETFEQRLVDSKFAEQFVGIVDTKFEHKVVSLYDIRSSDLCKDVFDVAKLSSNNLGNIPLLNSICQNYDTIVLDTKTTNYEELIFLLAHVREQSPDIKIIMQYSPARPPSLSNKWNLNSILWLRDQFKTFDVQVALSEHSDRIDQALIAIGLGVSFIEKGVMPENSYSEGDSDSGHCISILEVKEWRERIQQAYDGLGDQLNVSGGTSSEPNGIGLYLGNDKPEGSKIDATDLKCLFPCNDNPGRNYNLILGKRVKREFKSGSPIRLCDVYS